MLRNEFLEAIGFRYIVNHATREIHDVSHIRLRCRIRLIRHGGYWTRIGAWYLRKKKGYDGCGYCNRKHHHKKQQNGSSEKGTE